MSRPETVPQASAESGGAAPAGTPAPIRLLIADDHPVVRDGLSSMFARDPEFEVLGGSLRRRRGSPAGPRPLSPT